MPEYTWKMVLGQLLAGQDLDRDMAQWSMERIMLGEASDAQVAGFLVALRAKGETVTELRAIADDMADRAVPFDAPTDCLDIVGTGGDGFNTVNISSMACVVAAASGQRIVKHGNRAASSAAGSADVIEALGVDLALNPGQLAEVLRQVGITFCFAATFHPSMRHVGTARRDMGVPTAFNLLGPLTNPARPQTSLVGVAQEHVVPLLAGVFADRGVRAAVVRGREGLDEASTAGPSDVMWVHGGRITPRELVPEAVGVQVHPVQALRGGDAAANAQVARAVFGGERSPAAEAVVLNAGLAIAAASADELAVDADQRAWEAHVSKGVSAAREAIAQGAAQQTMERWVAASRAVG